MVEERIASLTVSTQSNFVAFLKPFVKSVAESISFNEKDSAELGDLIQNLAVRLSKLSSDGDNNQSINLNLFIRINELVIAIEHKGVPLKLKRANQTTCQSSPYPSNLKPSIMFGL